VADEENPYVLDSLPIPDGQARDVVIRGDYAFAAHYTGLKIIDISDPANLAIVSSAGNFYNSVDISGDLVFLGKGLEGGIDVFDISDVYNPAPVFSIPNEGGWAWDIKFHDDFIYLATDFAGLFMYEMSDDTAYEKATFDNIPNGQSFGVCLQDSLILLIGLINGVAILQYDSTGTVDVAENDGLENPLVFPNPSNGIFSVIYDISDLPDPLIEIYDAFGRKVYVGRESGLLTQGMINIDISYLPEGIYFLVIQSNRCQMKEKVILR
jgi:hypothetical protein